MTPATDTLATPLATDTGLHARAEHLLLAGLGLGIAGDYLLREGPLGPGLVLWLALLAAAALWLLRNADSARQRTLVLWSAVALGAALVTVLRAFEALIPAMLFVILACAVLTALESSGIALRSARIRDYFVTAFFFPLDLLSRTPRLLQQADISALTGSQRTGGIIRGTVIALPLLLVFGMLFASADAGFSRYLLKFGDIVSPRTLQHLLLVIVFGWLATSLLALACRTAPPGTRVPAPAMLLRLGTLEAHMVLALVSALFSLFVLLQLGYLFGGSEVIENTSGLTVAEHARRGFFELVVVAALALALLFGISLTDCEPRVLRRYGMVLIACVLIILVSALQRLFLYTDAFGMSIDRFSALAAILWLVINLLSFAVTVLRGDVTGFVSGVVLSGLSCLLLLGFVNPAGMVARINLERSIQQNSALDVYYLLDLGADALPPLLARLDELDANAQCSIAMYVGSRYPSLVAADTATEAAGEDWRQWNAGRAAARRAIREHLPEIEAGLARFEAARAATLETLATSPALVLGMPIVCE